MAVSVPKRLFKRAVDRNLLKRRIREAYRLQKPGFYRTLAENKTNIRIVIQYRGTEIADFHTIEQCLGVCWMRLVESLLEETTG
jgi:ribonuclease P protein component